MGRVWFKRRKKEKHESTQEQDSEVIRKETKGRRDEADQREQTIMKTRLISKFRP